MAHGLGRRPAPDERDRRFLMAAKLPEALPARPVRKTWRVWWKGDQGTTSQCVGYAWHGLLRSLPTLQRDPPPELIYREAQKVDEWDGEDYEGTSVRAGAKVLQAKIRAAVEPLRPYVLTYSWAWDLETVLNWLAFKGPVVFGCNWYSTMFVPDTTGLIKVGGSVEGGHATFLIGYAPTYLIGQNSWGKEWGPLNGRFHLSYDDVARLLSENGEACTATE